MIAPSFARTCHGKRKEVESNVTTPSDSLDSSSLKHKLTHLRDEKVDFSDTRVPDSQRGTHNGVEHNTIYLTEDST